jgi:hypothetical protein
MECPICKGSGEENGVFEFPEYCFCLACVYRWEPEDSEDALPHLP